MKRFLSSIVPALLVLISVLLIFYRGIFNFYFQDDFIHLTLGQVSSVSDFLKLFAPIEHFPYRPIAIQFLSFIAIYIFNLNPLPSHILLFMLHGINIILLWRVLGEIFGHRLAKFAVIFLYGASSIHFMLLYWWSILFMSLGTTFFLLCFLILSNCTTSGLYFFLFFLMLITNEALFVFPIFVTIYAYLFKKNHVKRLIIPSFIFSGLFIFLRIYLAKYPFSSDYRIGNLLEFVRTSKWYFLRTLNLPEGIKEMYPALPKGVTVVFKDTKVSPSEISVALSGDKALRLYYRDPSLQVVFGDDKSDIEIEDFYIISD